ncbi:MAG: SUF system NifU family Fe-S cluster assembly protein [Candidatus Moranbacteria bacterium]|nr:SUF system NifU family Fe-S cluster assembly protein [Candidatus Moranbacteria bacterium]NTW46109.1 SUF system NifU family Fe-S cluster assembly protein [Candidatus Moranbacteria bacterium]
MSSLYQAIILDHSRHPRNRGHLDHPTRHSEAKNQTCGDSLSADLLIRDGIIEDIRFEGEGCAISQASASLLSEAVKGKPVAAALDMNTDDILALLGVELSPNRLKCALLSLETLKKALTTDKITA